VLRIHTIKEEKKELGKGMRGDEQKGLPPPHKYASDRKVCKTVAEVSKTQFTLK